MMNVAPMDQHLSTSDGRSLIDNAATLAELSIYPETILNLKVSLFLPRKIYELLSVSKEV